MSINSKVRDPVGVREALKLKTNRLPILLVRVLLSSASGTVLSDEQYNSSRFQQSSRN